jgi:glutamate:GABA antiporter
MPANPDHHLRRQLALRDLIFTQILCVVGSSWVGVAAGLGRGQAVTWIAAMLLFYLPCAGSVVCLNRLMPLEGGLYVWAHTAFGDRLGFLTAWNLWVYGIIVTAEILSAIPTELSYLIGPRAAWLPESHAASLAIVSLLVLAIGAVAIRGLDLGKWVHNVGGIAMLTVFVVLIALPFWAIAHHHPVHYSPLPIGLPPRTLVSFALFGQMLVGALSGIEYIAILAGESKSPATSIGRSVWISSPVICLMFILGTSSVLAFNTPGHIDLIAPIPQTLRIALGNTGLGSLFATAAIALLQLRLLGAASYCFTGTTRLPMTTGWDNLIPAWFTRLHPRFRTPTNSILFTCGLILVMLTAATLGVHAQESFQVLSNASVTHYDLAYLAMFAIPLFGAPALRAQLPRWLTYTSLAGLLATAFAFLISAYPFVDVVNPRLYAAKILVTVLLSNLLGLAFYHLRNRR